MSVSAQAYEYIQVTNVGAACCYYALDNSSNRMRLYPELWLKAPLNNVQHRVEQGFILLTLPITGELSPNV